MCTRNPGSSYVLGFNSSVYKTQTSLSVHFIIQLESISFEFNIWGSRDVTLAVFK